MNKTGKYLYVIIGLLIFCNMATFVAFRNNKTYTGEVEDIALENKNKAEQVSGMLDVVTGLAKVQYMAEGEMLKNLSLYDINGDSCRLEEQLSPHPKLVYFFSENGCPGCFEPVLFKLDELGKKIGYDHILVLARFTNKRGFKTYWSDKPQQLPVFRVDKHLQLFYAHVNYDYACAFLLNNDRRIRKYVITDKSNVPITNEYFALMENYFKSLYQ